MKDHFDEIVDSLNNHQITLLFLNEDSMFFKNDSLFSFRVNTFSNDTIINREKYNQKIIYLNNEVLSKIESKIKCIGFPMVIYITSVGEIKSISYGFSSKKVNVSKSIKRWLFGCTQTKLF